MTPDNLIWILALCLCFSVFYPHWHALQLHCRPRPLPLHRKINGINTLIVISIISIVSEWRWKQVLVWPAGGLPYWPSTAWRQRGWVSEAKYVTIVTFNIDIQTHTNLMMSFRMWRILWIGGTQWSVSHKWWCFSLCLDFFGLCSESEPLYFWTTSLHFMTNSMWTSLFTYFGVLFKFQLKDLNSTLGWTGTKQALSS